MYKRIFKTISAALMITVFTSSAVFADNVTDLQIRRRRHRVILRNMRQSLHM